ncbi:MAG: glycosyltransferase [Bacteroidetes bacterium]|nr:glycosyltransferase [Bacteroidota bacterium]MBU1116627.1 glycosyltransferase [Bacteroidota bacterium]MBU1797744.1 glycosyltransferase [Bacteroidota bacterium]
MKITILSAAYPLRGGIAHFASLLYKELVKTNSVDVVTFKRQYPSFLFPGKTQLETGDNLEIIPTKIEMDSINPFNWIKVGRRIKSNAPDLLIIKHWMPFFAPIYGTISRIVRKNKKTKIGVICHNIIPHEKKPGDKVFTKYFFNSVEYFITLSKSVQDDLISLYPNAKQKLLFHPVYSNFGESVSKQISRDKLNLKSDKIMLFFGFIRDYKGLDILLEAIALIKNKMDFTLVVAGEFYSNQEQYISLIQKLEIENRVKLFSDFIPTNEVKYYFSACDVVVLPYKSATQSGIVQIANNFDKPMISTNVGGLSEVIENGKTGYLVEKENPKQLADAILKYFNENKEAEFVENIKKEAAKYSWSEFVNGMMELIETKQK